jgi:hypothetical protein
MFSEVQDMRPNDYRAERILLAVMSGIVGGVASLISIPLVYGALDVLGLVLVPIVFAIVTLAYCGIGLMCTTAVTASRSFAYGEDEEGQWVLSNKIGVSAAWPVVHLPLVVWYLMTWLIREWSTETVRETASQPARQTR